MQSKVIESAVFRTCILFLILVLLSAGGLSAQETDGWDLLVKNRIEEALKVFQEQLKNGTITQDGLEGLYQIYRLKCYPEGCVDIGFRLLRSARTTPLGVTHINRIESNRLYFDSFDTLYTRAGEIAKLEDLHPVTRNAINSFLLQYEKEKCDFAAMKQYSETSGLLKHWNFTIGPFSSRGHSRLSRLFPPEQNLGAAEYTYKAETVKQNGIRYYIDEFNSDIYLEKEKGTLVYMVSLIKAAADTEILITLYPPSGTKVWLNGYPVILSEDSIGKDIRSMDRKVKLVKGVNVITVKTLRNRLDLRLRNTDYSPFTGFTPVQDVPEGLLEKGVKQVYGFRFSEVPEDPVKVWKPENNSQKLAQIQYYRDYGMTEDYRNAVVEHPLFPDKSGLNHLLKTYYFQYAERSGNDLSTRMKNEYRNELDTTIELLGEQPRLLKIKGNILIENKLHKEGKKLLDKGLEFSEGAVEIHRSLLSYFYERDWDVEIEKTYNTLISKSPWYLDDYFSFLKKRKRYTQAREMLKKSFDAHVSSMWDYFDEMQDFTATEEVEKYANLLMEAFPYRRDDICSDLGYYYYKLGEYEKAETCLKEVYEKPDESGYSHNLLSELAYEQGRKDEALKLWKERAALGKGVPALYRRIRKAEKKPLHIMKYDIDVLNEFNERDLDIKAYPESDFVNLLDLFLVQIHTDGSYEGVVHRAYLVVSKNGSSELGEISLPEDADDTLYCRTISKERDSFIPTSIKEADSKRYASMPNVGPGAVIDYAYMISGKGEEGIQDLSFGYTFGESKEPTLKVLQIVAAPKDTKLYFRNNKGKSPERKEEDGLDIYIWDREDLEGLENENSMPPLRELVENGTIQGKSNFHSYQTGLFYDDERFYSSVKTENLGRELLAQAKTRREKITSCLEWMREHLEDTGEASSVRDCIILERGSSSMKMRLLTYWLSLENIPCTDVYTNAQFFMKERRESGGRDLQYFRRNLLLIPGENGNFPVWLDINGNFKYADHSLLSGNDINSCAVYYRDGRLVIGRVKEQQNDLKNSEYSFSLSVEETGDAGASSKGIISGGLSARLRKILKDNPQNRKKVLESLAKQVLPRIHVKENVFDGEEDLKKPVIHKFTGRILSFAKKENEALSFNPFIENFNLKSLLGSEDRDFEYVLYSPRQERYMCEFTIPEGYYFSRIPERCMISSQYGLYIADFRVEGRTLKSAVSVAIPAMRIPPESYGIFTAFLKEIIKYEMKPVIINRYDAPEGVAVNGFLPVKVE